jgi:hypothetical protein
MPVLVNIKSGKERYFSQRQLLQALKSGEWRGRTGDTLYLQDKYLGDRVAIDATTDIDSIERDLAPESAESIRHRVEEDRLARKYDYGVLNTGRALLEGAARGLSFGLSDAIMTGLGASEEGLRERRIRNTIAAPVGEVSGALGPLLFSGGLAAPGVAARGSAVMRFTPAGRALMAGEKAGAAVAVRLASAAKGGRLARTAAAVAPVATTGAVETALYGAGMGLSNTVLSDDPFSAEALVSNMGSGALYGAGVGAIAGGAFGLLGHGAQGVKAFREARAAKRAQKLAAGGKITGKAKEFNSGLYAISKSGRSMEGYVKLDRDVHGAFGRAFDDAYDDLIRARDRFDATGLANEKGQFKITESNLRNLAAKEPARYDEVVDAIEGYRVAQVRMAEELVNSGASTVKVGRHVSDDMMSPAHYMKNVKGLGEAKEGLDGLSKLAVANEASDGVLGVSLEDAGPQGSLVDKFLKLNFLSVLLRGKGITGAKPVMAGRTVGSLTRRGMAGKGGRGEGVQARAYDAYTKTADAIGKGVSGFTRAGKRAGHFAALSVLNNASFGDRESKPGRPRKAAEGRTAIQRAYLARTKEIRTSVADLEGTMAKLSERLKNLRAIDPKLAQQAMSVAARKLAYYNSKIPAGPKFGALNSKAAIDYVPSDMEIAKFARIVNALENPTYVLRNMASLQLTPDEAQAVKVVYPAIYSKIQETILHTLANIDKPLSFPKLIQLSILWDLPAHSAMRSEFTNRLRYTFTQQQPTQQPQMAKLKSSPETQETAIQRMAQK